jgi:carbonic anhydrase
MTNSRNLLLLLAIGALGAGCATHEAGIETHQGAHPVHWSYEGEGAPSNWGKLDETFATCASGRIQSPIDIEFARGGQGQPLRFEYAGSATGVQNNGHTVQVDYGPGNVVTLDGRPYTLTQFHFHVPAENTIAGQRYPMEAHFVHADADGHLAVVAVMFEEGAPNRSLESLWKDLPASAGARHAVASSFAAASVYPGDLAYWRFDGSLTTPPCSEGVKWFVLRTPVSASREQIDALAKVLPGPNNRPVQPLNGRVVSG